MRHSTGRQDPYLLYIVVLLCLFGALPDRLAAWIEPQRPAAAPLRPLFPSHGRAASATL
jgi:hypothetical protein